MEYAKKGGGGVEAIGIQVGSACCVANAFVCGGYRHIIFYFIVVTTTSVSAVACLT